MKKAVAFKTLQKTKVKAYDFYEKFKYVKRELSMQHLEMKNRF